MIKENNITMTTTINENFNETLKDFKTNDCTTNEHHKPQHDWYY